MTQKRYWRRHGGIAPLTCVLLVGLLGMVAFAVDISWIALSQSELQNSADAAALAGANKLADNYVLHALPSTSSVNKASLRATAVADAKTAAKAYAAYHSAGGVNLTLLDGDIDVGYTSSAGVYTSYASDNSKYPNTVKVTMRRDSSANTSLTLFFGSVLGLAKTDLNAQATASLYTATVDGFKAGSTNSGMLPVAFDYNDWTNFIATGKDVDGNSNVDSSGNPQLQVYGTIKHAGNFGLISLNDSHVGASTIAGWIHDGVPPSDIQALKNSNLIPLSAHNPNLWDWQGDTGFKAANCMDINQHVGETFMMPLFKPVTTTPYLPGVGNGSNFSFNVVAFVGVKIMPSTQTNRDVWIQPVAVSDPNAIYSNVTIADGNTFATSFTVKLTK